MGNMNSTIILLALSAIAAIGGSYVLTRPGTPPSDRPAAPATVSAPAPWSATAPGRVEPRNGEIRLSAGIPGRIVEVAVALNDTVVAGETIVRLDDEEARARVAAADAEVQVRRRERDAETTTNRLALDRRQAEDTLAASERSLAVARSDLDRIARAKRNGAPLGAGESIEGAQKAVADALEKVETDRAALRRAQAAPGVPLPTRVEAGLTAARAELSLAEAVLERTRLRTPIGGTVLQLAARVGENAAATPEQALAVIGDLSLLRVRAELEERDVAKVKAGQAAIVRSDAYPGREFPGRVAVVAKMLAPAKLAQRGPRRPTDQDSLEILVDLDAAPELLPGMRVDVYFRAPAGEKRATAAVPPATSASVPAASPTAGSGGTSVKGTPAN
jgi:HlyD family secretion protein